jgi:hypothetical protein
VGNGPTGYLETVYVIALIRFRHNSLYGYQSISFHLVKKLELDEITPPPKYTESVL